MCQIRRVYSFNTSEDTNLQVVRNGALVDTGFDPVGSRYLAGLSHL